MPSFEKRKLLQKNLSRSDHGCSTPKVKPFQNLSRSDHGGSTSKRYCPKHFRRLTISSLRRPSLWEKIEEGQSEDDWNNSGWSWNRQASSNSMKFTSPEKSKTPGPLKRKTNPFRRVSTSFRRVSNESKDKDKRYGRTSVDFKVEKEGQIRRQRSIPGYHPTVWWERIRSGVE